MVDELIIKAALRDELSGPIGHLRGEVRQLARDVDRVEGSTRRADRSTRTWGLGLSRLHGGLRRTTSLLGGLARSTGLVSGLAAAGVVTAIYKVGSAYSTQLNIFQGVTRANVAQMDAVRKQAQLLGRDLDLPATSAADAAAAMTELAKGGLSVRDAMLAAHGTLQLAAAASVDGAVAAQIQANAINQFRLKGSDAARVADVLANAANAASGEVTDVALALGYVGPIAAGMGEDITSTTTAIGLLAKNGILAEKAGTGLRGMIGALANPSEKAADALNKLGVDAFDNQGHFRGFRSIIEQVSKAQKRMSDEQFTSNAAAAFGREPLAALVALAKEGTAGYDAMAKAVGRQGGAAEVARARNKGFKGALDGLKSTLEGIGIEIYTSAEPALAKWTRSAAEKLPKLEKQIKDIYGAIRAGNIDKANHLLSGLLTGDENKLVRTLERIEGGVRDAYRAAKAGGTIFRRDLLPPLKVLAELTFGAILVGLRVLRGLLEFVASHESVADILWAIVGAMVAFKAVVIASSFINGMRYFVTGLKAVAAAEGAAAVIRALTTEMIGLDVAMAANPVGVIVAAVVALGIAFVLAYQHSETFRIIVKAAIAGVLSAVQGLISAFSFLFRALGHAPGMGWATGVADKLDEGNRKLQEMKDRLNGLPSPTVTVHARLEGPAAAQALLTPSGVSKGKGQAAVGGQPKDLGGFLNQQTGDTSRSMVAAGNLGRTLAFHARMRGPGVKITNALVGGGGLGYGSGDHQSGKALDLVGPGLPSYRARARAAGAFAEFHGSGEGRHLHMAIGDTSSSRAPGGGGGPAVLLAPNVEVRVEVTNAVPSEVDISAATARGVRQGMRAVAAYGYDVVEGGRGGRST